MVYTITLNPALDYVMEMSEFCTGKINLSNKENIFPGGKGINVSFILNELGIDSTALGFVAGFSGEEIERLIKEKGISCDFIKLERGNSRINVKLRHSAETDINAAGPEIDEKHLNMFFDKINSLTEQDTVVIAGSLPRSLSSGIYKTLAKHLNDKNISFIVDAAGDNLLGTLQYNPFLIKPNLEELKDIFQDFEEEKLYEYMKKLQSMGAKNILVSMGGKGSVLLDETGEYDRLDACKGKIVNTVGAGDSMVAGFIAGYIKTKDYKYAHRLGAASGSATAFSEQLAMSKNIFSLFQKNS